MTTTTDRILDSLVRREARRRARVRDLAKTALADGSTPGLARRYAEAFGRHSEARRVLNAALAIARREGR